jgi:hypothetical protein
MPGRDELPSTLKRSPKKAQETWIQTHDSGVQEYGEGERAHRTAFSSLKHSFEKVGDHWETKEDGHKGPSDEQSAQPGLTPGDSFGGVDANASKKHLLEIARQLGIRGRSTMRKQELAAAIQRANDRETAKARS